MADMASITAGLNAVKLAFNIAKDLKDATAVNRHGFNRHLGVI